MTSILFPLRTKQRRTGREIALWKSSLPFVDNGRAILLHRPREITSYHIHKYPHLAVHCFCGACFTGNTKFTFLAIPGDDKLLCRRCEDIAVHNGLPSADEIAGRHIHVGGLVPKQLCCKQEADKIKEQA